MANPASREEFKDYCLQNKYTKWYFTLVEQACSRNWNKKTAPVYVEGHHIIPKSISKNNDLVYLTAREHFICHLLLTKMLDGNDGYKMLSAFIAMKMIYKNTKQRYINSIFYDSVRKKISEFKKEQWKDPIYREHIITKVSNNRPDMSGDKNPMFGRVGPLSPHYNKPKSEEHKNKIKNSLLGKKHTDERKLNMSINSPKCALGKKWYYNPETKKQKYFVEGTQPDGFILGRK